MKIFIITTTVATLISGAALAQANPNASQPSSDGRGVNIPGVSTTGRAIDRPDSNQSQENADMRVLNNDNRMSVDDGSGRANMRRDRLSR